MELTYRPVARFVRTFFWFQGLEITVVGQENVPPTGGAVIAINHTSYLDFTFAALPPNQLRPKRWVRFMAKQEVFDNRYTGWIMRGCRHIPVDRNSRESGHDAFAAAVDYLTAGELVGVYPEATISRSFELKEFKSGAVRMAIEAGVPIVPTIVWGAQRIWTKDHPKRLGRVKVPIRITVGEPIEPTLPLDDLSALLRARMQQLLEQTQDAYGPHPAAEFWVPHRLGGGAPTLAEAGRLDAEEVVFKRARAAEAAKAAEARAARRAR